MKNITVKTELIDILLKYPNYFSDFKNIEPNIFINKINNEFFNEKDIFFSNFFSKIEKNEIQYTALSKKIQNREILDFPKLNKSSIKDCEDFLDQIIYKKDPISSIFQQSLTYPFIDHRFLNFLNFNFNFSLINFHLNEKKLLNNNIEPLYISFFLIDIEKKEQISHQIKKNLFEFENFSKLFEDLNDFYIPFENLEINNIFLIISIERILLNKGGNFSYSFKNR